MVFRGQRYFFTRLGFGLNVAPLIMKTVLDCVVARRSHKGTSAYIDDIYVNEDIIKATNVEEHLRNFGLTNKPHE